MGEGLKRARAAAKATRRMPITTKRVHFTVSFHLPHGASVEQALRYVEAAVRGWQGGLAPEDPMWTIAAELVNVQHIR